MITAINFFLYFFGSGIELVAITFMLTPKKSKLSAFIIMFMPFFSEPHISSSMSMTTAACKV